MSNTGKFWTLIALGIIGSIASGIISHHWLASILTIGIYSLAAAFLQTVYDDRERFIAGTITFTLGAAFSILGWLINEIPLILRMCAAATIACTVLVGFVKIKR